MILSLLLSLLVTLAWLWFFVRRDIHPEPPLVLARTFGWGMFAWVVAAAFEVSLGRLLSSNLPIMLLLTALLTAIIEEVSKFLAAHTAIHEPSFDEPMDGLVYAVTAALGFALIENLTYTLSFGAGATTQHALLATLAHALFSAPQGYALGRHWTSVGRWWRRRGLLLSIALHFVFNALLSIGAGSSVVFALGGIMALMMVLTGRYYLAYEEAARAIALAGQSPPRPPELWPTQGKQEK